MPQYEYVVVDTTTGDGLESIPLSGVRYTQGMNGAGSFNATMATSHKKCRRSLLQTLSREILVLRDNVPVFNGPILGLNAQGKDLQISAAPPWWYMTKRTMELGRNYVEQSMNSIFDDIMTTVNGKFAGDIRLTKKTPFNVSTQNYTISYDATSRKIAAEAITDLSMVYPGFDWSVDLRVDATTGKTLREYQIYPGFKGVLVDQALTMKNTIDFSDVDDGTRVYNRVHELGAGQDNTQLIVSRSAYEPDAYYDYGEYLTGWLGTGVNTVVDQAVGRPAPAFRFSNGGAMNRSYEHGVGSKIEFDYYHSGTGAVITSGSSSDVGQLNNSGVFNFGCNGTGGGMGFGSFISRFGVQGCGLALTSTFGGVTTNEANNTVSNLRLRNGTWYRVLIEIRSSTVAHVYVNGTKIQAFNGTTYSFDFPIALSGTYVGMGAPGVSVDYGLHFYDNITVPKSQSTYTNPGIPYIEHVASRTDVTDLKTLQFYAQADLYLGAWPSRVYSVKYRPSSALPFNFCAPGDTVPLDFDDGYYQVTGTKRVVSIPVTVENSGAEVVELVFNDTHA